MRRPVFFLALVFAAACSQTQDFTTPAAPGPPVEPLGDPTCGVADDPNNCGACGHSCFGGVCSSGVCQPTVLAQGQIADDGYGGPQLVTIDDHHVFWGTSSVIARVGLDGGAVEKLAQHGFWGDDRMRIEGGFLYLPSRSLDSIARIPIDGGAEEVITPKLTDNGTVQQFDIRNGTLAYTDGTKVFVCDAIPCTAPRDLWGATDMTPDGIGRGDANLYVGYEYPNGKGTGIDTIGGAYGSTLVTQGYGSLVVEEKPDQAIAYGGSIGFVGRAIIPLVTPTGNQPYVPDKVLASGTEIGWAQNLVLDGDDLYWVSLMCEDATCVNGTLYRVDKTGATLPEHVLDGWGVVSFTVGKDAIYFGTDDGRIAKLAKPLRPGKPPPQH